MRDGYNDPVRLVPGDAPPLVIAVDEINGAFAGVFNGIREAIASCEKDGRRIVNRADFAHLLEPYIDRI